MIRAILLLVTFSAQGFAADSKMTKIQDATLYCGKRGVVYAFNMTRGQERVWQTDSGQTEGLELSKVQVKTYRCPYCWDVSGELVFQGKKINEEFKIRKSGNTVNATVILTSQKKVVDTFEVSCK